MMDIDSGILVNIVAVGIGATLLIDLWNLLLRRAFGIRSLSYCMLGRWLCHMTTGTFRHMSISNASQKPLECMIGWIAHYTIGVTFALVFVVVASTRWLARPTLLPALLFGIATVVFPLFVMQPAFGLGIAAARTPKPMQARIKSIGTHAVFGVGLYLGALAIRDVLPIPL